jgi:hypothetical protein
MSQLQRLDNRSAMLRHVLTSLVLGFLLGIASTIENPSFSVIHWISLNLFFGFLGLCVWLCRRNVVKHREINALRESMRGRHRSAWGELRTEEPSSYRSRMARFLDRDETDLEDLRPAPVSKMEYWCLLDKFELIPPKPAWFIRRLLRRIRATVRDEEV